MKRSLKYFTLLVALLVVITGCSFGKKDSKTQLEDAINKTTDAKSAKVKMDLTASASMQGTTLDISMTADAEEYQQSDDVLSGHAKVNMSLLGMSQSSEVYMDVKDGYLYTYTGSDGEWTYTKSEYKVADKLSKEKISEYVNKAKEIKEEKSDKKGYTKLFVTISSDEINKLYNDSELKTEEVSNVVSKDVTFTVYLKDGYVTIVEMDLTDTIKDLVSQLGSYAEELKNLDVSAKLSVEFSDFNKVDKITVPEDVINNATEETDASSSALDSILGE